MNVVVDPPDVSLSFSIFGGGKKAWEISDFEEIVCAAARAPEWKILGKLNASILISFIFRGAVESKADKS